MIYPGGPNNDGMGLKGEEDKAPDTKFFIKYEQKYTKHTNKDTFLGLFWVAYYIVI